MSWNSFKNKFGRATDEFSDAVQELSNRNYELNVNSNPRDGFSIGVSSTRNYPPLPLIIGLAVGGGVLILLLVLCCCCCKRSTRGRILVPPSANPPPAPAPTPFLVHIHHGTPGAGLYPGIPSAAPYEMNDTSAAASGCPPPYDTERLLPPELKSRTG